MREVAQLVTLASRAASKAYLAPKAIQAEERAASGGMGGQGDKGKLTVPQS